MEIFLILLVAKGTTGRRFIFLSLNASDNETGSICQTLEMHSMIGMLLFTYWLCRIKRLEPFKQAHCLPKHIIAIARREAHFVRSRCIKIDDNHFIKIIFRVHYGTSCPWHQSRETGHQANGFVTSPSQRNVWKPPITLCQAASDKQS